jgi:hypothetical protein
MCVCVREREREREREKAGIYIYIYVCVYVCEPREHTHSPTQNALFRLDVNVRDEAPHKQQEAKVRRPARLANAHQIQRDGVALDDRERGGKHVAEAKREGE